MKKKVALVAVMLCALAAAMLVRGTSRAAAEEASGEEANEQVAAEELLSELDISGLTAYFESLTDEQKAYFGSDLREYISRAAKGEIGFGYSSFISYLFGAIGVSLGSVAPLLLTVLAVAVLVAFIGGMKGGFGSRTVDGVVNFAGVALVSALVLLQVFGVIRRTSALVTSLRTQMEAVFPVLFTLMSALGASGSVAVYSPAVAALTFSVTELLSTIALPLLIVTLVFSIIGNFSSAVTLSGMAKFVCSVAKWIMYTSFFLFLAFLTVQGVTAAVYDSVSVRSAKFALAKYVPVIGGYLSDGFNVILAGTALIKNAVGLTAVILMFVSVAPVLMEVIVVSLALRLMSALTEAVGVKEISGLLGSVSSSVNLLISVVCGITFLYFIFLLLLIISGNLVF